MIHIDPLIKSSGRQAVLFFSYRIFDFYYHEKPDLYGQEITILKTGPSIKRPGSGRAAWPETGYYIRPKTRNKTEAF